MRFPTLPEMADSAECFVFGHDWYRTKTADGAPVNKCSNCGEVERR